MADEDDDKPALEPPPPPEEECVQKIGTWMATFADLVTLLMCFFVLLFAMSTTQEETFKELIQSLRSALGVQEVPMTGTREGLTMINEPKDKTDTPAVDEMGGMIKKELDEIVSDVKELVMFNNLQGLVNVKETDDGAIITVSDLVLFKPGQTQMGPKGLKIMQKLSKVLKQFRYPIKIVGHTDNIPVRGKFNSNWDLSSSRASNVVKFLIQNRLNPTLLSAQGMAEFHPVATNDTKAGRSKNRRVEIIYERNSIMKVMEKKRK
ncbi:MAG: flagellar motor protein MotB [Desulfobacterales bacterium]|nr:flagellar motor protein MotB [Desulfobacterales bacterium]MCP4160006.1 flagellar motor protein MotB [Deltaproteobacteria bacterium]